MDDSVIRRRRFCAWVWIALGALGVQSRFGDAPELIIYAWFGALAMTLITVASCRLADEQRLVRPRLYRAASIALLAVALEGVAFGFVPDASELSHLMAVYFGLIAVLAYRAVVARGPGASLLATTLGLVCWLPIGMITMMGCKCGAARFRVPHWTEAATWTGLQVTLLLLVLATAAALVAFAPRKDCVPDARLVA